MITWQELRKVHPWLPESSEGWHQHSNGGGWVKDSARVSGSAIVCGSAVVSDSAHVCGSAVVSGSARVSDSAHVCGSAVVSGSARVSDSVIVCDSARVSGSAVVTKTPIHIFGLAYDILICDKFLTIGCQQHTRDQWRRFSDKRIAGMHRDAAAFWKSHRDALLAICKAHQSK